MLTTATGSGTRTVNKPNATNVAQIVISGTWRSTPGAMSMPAFGSTYSDAEIAAVASYVTGRFGGTASKLTAKEVKDLRGQTAR
jgi:mono/diheme cytochrome c family protein